ncbi:MAG: phosphodiesterase [Gammaproteobacteria bacterium]|nr:MAG: phosphodiesterase [Gammaproteobacteria bacterium]
MESKSRRQFFGYMAVGLSTPYLLSACGGDVQNPSAEIDQQVVGDSALFNTQALTFNSPEVFEYSIGSGDPTESGVILWTRVAETALLPGESLFFQVSRDSSFLNGSLVVEGEVEAIQISSLNDYTVHIDLDNQLEAGTRYFYRFVYNNTASRVGRCRTAPAEDEALARVKFALLTCQDYTNGFYGALRHIAEDASIDFVIHLGDFIYETVGDPSFQSLPFDERLIDLPSGGVVSLGLDDFRKIYRTAYSDPSLQLAMETHTWIITTDDHETANDCYWDYERDTLGAPDHPYTLDPEFNNDAELLRQLKLDAQRAWAEYVPTRVGFDLNASHPHDAQQVYREFKFGNLVQLFMTDTRTYRTSHPCGESSRDRVGKSCPEVSSEEQSLYGMEQREWLLDGLSNSTQQWKLLGNQVFMGRLGLFIKQLVQLPFSVDAWDGYEFERALLAQYVLDHGVENFVVVTGDLHSTMASHLRQDYNTKSRVIGPESPGVEFMTPAVTSSNLGGLILSENPRETVENLVEAISNGTVRVTNPHIRYFNSLDYGYSTIEFTSSYCEWRAFAVDKDNRSDSVVREQIAAFRKYPELPELVKA